jgi:hypothetical protein
MIAFLRRRDRGTVSNRRDNLKHVNKRTTLARCRRGETLKRGLDNCSRCRSSFNIHAKGTDRPALALITTETH